MDYNELIEKYNIPVPRYTSYPTVPYWETETFDINAYKKSIKNTFLNNKEDGISIYIHLPFCESLCTFCACNKRITKRHEVEQPYIEYLLKEWQMYLYILGEKPLLKELHLGGGTPTFFSSEHLQKLLQQILKSVNIADNHAFSFEGHPNNTSEEHLQVLYDLGFRRVSFGVQDYDEKVQKAIHRIQPFEKVKEVTELARKIGYESVSHDLVFGLPFQELAHLEKTIQLTNELKPDRIAFYSYAHVPWIKGIGQRGFDENDLPSGVVKRELYEKGKLLFAENGYEEIALDHFALPEDALCKAMNNQTIHRNFMGYTEQHTSLLIGLGMSAISDAWNAFAQNEKKLEDYYQKLDNDILPVSIGHNLSEEDAKMRQYILDIMCRLETTIEPNDFPSEYEKLEERLKTLEQDGLIILKDNHLKVTTIGKAFLRNVGLAFDLRYLKKLPKGNLFSMSV